MTLKVCTHQGSLTFCCVLYKFWQVHSITSTPSLRHADEFHIPKISSSTIPPPNTPAISGNNHLTVCKVLPSPECHTVEIIDKLAFSDWLLSLSNVTEEWSMSFSTQWFIYFWTPNNISGSGQGNIKQLPYSFSLNLFTHRRTLYILPVHSDYE